MRKIFKHAALPAALILGLTGAAFAAHGPVTLRDATGAAIPALDADGDGAWDTAPAFSAKETCGVCHDYDAIEQGAFHAQLGANQFKGWDNWNPDSSDKFKKGVAPKGKNWVQSPGHFGKW